MSFHSGDNSYRRIVWKGIAYDMIGSSAGK